KFNFLPHKIMTIPIIRFNFPTPITIGSRTRLKKFLISIIKKEGKRLAELQYIFCSDDYLLGINQQYLGHNDFTDIITFDLAEKGKPINAEIYISVDRVKDNARQFSSTLKDELQRVMIHGVLHLCGYKDKTPKDQAQMRKKEDQYLQAYKTFHVETK
ncbi:MAG TPA: rRNA maturation RNase YbeY, partial [Waddliaceae bacterium]